MKVLLDTNVLIRLSDNGSAQHSQALASVAHLHSLDYILYLVPQILYEYWVVTTRPVANNGLGMNAVAASARMAEWLELFPLISKEPDIFERWKFLVTEYDVRGKNAHDARIAAAMQHHNIGILLTFNKPDFMRFPFILSITPDDVLSGKWRS